MADENEKSDWLDFNAIKKPADVRRILESLGVLDGLGEQGSELVGWCPIGTRQHGKKDSFHFNIEKKTFQCFACKNRGSVLDFVARFEGIALRDAAARVRNIMDSTNVALEPDEQSDEPLLASNRRKVADVKVYGWWEALAKASNQEIDPEQVVVLEIPGLK